MVTKQHWSQVSKQRPDACTVARKTGSRCSQLLQWPVSWLGRSNRDLAGRTCLSSLLSIISKHCQAKPFSLTFLAKMQFKALTFAALVGTVFGQAPPDLVTALGSLPQLANLTTYLSAYPDFVAQLGGLTNITLLAPNNDAFAQLLNSSAGAALTTGDASLIQALFSYHVLNGTYQSFNETQFVPTALQPPQFTNVTGGQVVQAIPGDDGVTFLGGLLQNVSTTGNATNFTGGVIHIIDTVLTIPQNISTTAVQLGLASIAGALTAADLVETVDYLSDVTVFVPNNEAFQAIGSALPNLTTEQVTAILTYHVVQGTVGYSTLLSNTSLATVQGNDVTISIVDGDVFVNSARVLIPDVLVANGVVHVIDNVLNPDNSTATPDPAAETQAPAFAGASSASDVPFTSGIATPTSTIATTEASAEATATSSGIAVPMKTGAVGAAALFGGAAIVMNL